VFIASDHTQGFTQTRKHTHSGSFFWTRDRTVAGTYTHILQKINISLQKYIVLKITNIRADRTRSCVVRNYFKIITETGLAVLNYPLRLTKDVTVSKYLTVRRSAVSPRRNGF
jgi:hypothetical protein